VKILNKYKYNFNPDPMKKFYILLCGFLILVSCSSKKSSSIIESVDQFIKSKLNKGMVLDELKIVRVDSVTRYSEVVNDFTSTFSDLKKERQVREFKQKIYELEANQPYYKGNVWWEKDRRINITDGMKDQVSKSDSIIKRFERRMGFLSKKINDPMINNNKLQYSIDFFSQKLKDPNLDKNKQSYYEGLVKRLKDQLLKNQEVEYYLVYISLIITPDGKYEYKLKLNKDFEVQN
jgi:hypothetical protein